MTDTNVNIADDIKTAVASLRLLELAVSRAFHYDLGLLDRSRPEISTGGNHARPSPALWHDGPETLVVAYAQSMQELARAHRCFGRTGAPNHWVTNIGYKAAHREHLQEVDTFDRARQRIKWLRQLFGWAQLNPLQGGESAAVLEACGHAKAALQRLPEALYVVGEPDEAGSVLCRNSENGCRNGPRPGGKFCQTCVNFRSRKGYDRQVGEDGRTLKVKKAS